MTRDTSSLILACALAAPLCAGCFNDGGGSSSSYGLTGAGNTDAGTGGATDPGASSTTSASTSSDATSTTAGATGSPTTGDGSSTTTMDPDTSTGEPGSCPGECTPGQVEPGGACDPCGTESRTCGDDCTWGEWSCVEPDGCALWSLPVGDQQWNPIRWDELGNADLAPSAPIEASFSANAIRRAFILTHDTYHVLDLDEFGWVDAGDRDSMFPDLAGATLLIAFSYNDGELMGGLPTSTENVSMLTTETSWYYGGFDPESYDAAEVSEVPCCDDNEGWQVPEAPAVDDVRAMWMDIVGENTWINPMQYGCSQEQALGPHAVALTESMAHVQDITQCFEYTYAAGWEDFPPLTLAGAPSSGALIGGAFYMHEEVFLVGADPG